MALMQLTVIPLGTSTASVGKFVAEMQKILASEKFPYQLNDMATVVEGEVQDLLALAHRLHEMPFADNVDRVVTHIAIDERRDKKVGLGDKIASVG